MGSLKAKILEALCAHREGWVSGAKLAEELMISRVAVWKHIKALEADGYLIESRAARGYRLIAIPDLLLPFEIRRGLKTKFVGRRIFHYEEVSSTQEVAKRLATEGGEEEGALVVAESQTAGRGRRNRGWCSPRGGLYLSIILKPKMPPSRAPLMALLAGLAIAKTIRKICGLKAELKWPNDILIRGKKVGGILIEIAAEADLISWIVVGIGLNANVRLSSLSPELRMTATSLEEECKEKVSRVEILRKLLEEVEHLCQILKEEGAEAILKEWKSMTNIMGVPVRVTNGDVIEGVAVDLDQEGALIIKTYEGKIRRVVAGDVSLRRKE